jgi:hypothetical protein
MLWYKSTNVVSVPFHVHPESTLTARNNNPDEVHEKEVEPEVIRFRSAVCQILVVVIEHGRSIVKHIAVYLT